MIQQSADPVINDRASTLLTHRMRLLHAEKNALLLELLSDRFTHTSDIKMVASTLLN
jgi:hypothetical protein